MSAGGPGRREVAHRLFAAEYDDASLEYAESDEERAPNYVVTPSGARVNRLFVVGVLTAVEQVNEDTVRARIADPTGVFVVYAGQYQPDELAALQSLESPAFVAVTGKANTFSPEGSDRVLTSVRPERVTEVYAETRDRWVVATAEHTLSRIQTIAGALQREERDEDLRGALLREGVEPGFAEGVAKALDHYDTTADYLGALRDLATQALEVVADERSEVDALEIAPDEGDGTVSAGDLTDLLPDERRSATEAAEDVDPEVLLESEASDAGEPAAEAVDDADQNTDGATETGADGEAGAEASGSDVEEPETDEPATEEAASDSEEAADAEAAAGAEPDDTDEPEPEPSGSAAEEPAVEETAGDTEEAARDTEEAARDTEEAARDAEETAGDADASAETPAAGESAEADAADEMYEVDEEEREQIEEEYGVGFQSGTEVDPAGEAGIETEDEPPVEEESVDEPESAADDAADETAADEDETPETSDKSGEDEADSDGTDDAEASEDSDEDADLEGAVLAEMDALDDGDGADREALVAAVADETGADADAIDDAIDDLLMSGQCYEPSEGSLKPI
jgi:RPA family protein